MSVRILQGNCLDVLRTLPDASVHCCVTSPPYWGLRDYGTEPVPWPAVSYEPMPGLGHAVEVPAGHASLGLEPTIAEFLGHMVAVFREVRRVLRDDGTCWVNMGDSYNAAGRVGQGAREGYKQGTNRASAAGADSFRPSVSTLKPKDLIGQPWRLAFALQADGWWLRQDIIWHKPNPMPESVRDRCTKSHEQIFLLAKSANYYCDMEAIKEPAVADHAPGNHSHKGATAYEQEEGEHHRTKAGLVAYAQRQRGKGGKNAFRGQGHFRDSDTGPANREGRDMQDVGAGDTRNKRSVWTVATEPFKEAHFATFPPALIEPCIKAGCPVGGTVLDPFGGAGTTGMVADRLQRHALLIELNPEYAGIAQRRIAADAPLFAEVTS